MKHTDTKAFQEKKTGRVKQCCRILKRSLTHFSKQGNNCKITELGQVSTYKEKNFIDENDFCLSHLGNTPTKMKRRLKQNKQSN